MRVILEDDDGETVLSENASMLETDGAGLTVGTMFEEPQFIKGAMVKSIDFLSGRVIVIRRREGISRTLAE